MGFVLFVRFDSENEEIVGLSIVLIHNTKVAYLLLVIKQQYIFTNKFNYLLKEKQNRL